MLRSPFHVGRSADAEEPGENAAPQQSSTAAGVWAQHDPQTEERLKPPPASHREQPQRKPTAQPSDASGAQGHAKRSTDLLALNVEPPEPWQRVGASRTGEPSIDDWLPPLPKTRPAAAGTQSGLEPPTQTSASPDRARAQATKPGPELQPGSAAPAPQTVAYARPPSVARSHDRAEAALGAAAHAAARTDRVAGAPRAAAHRPLPLGVQPMPVERSEGAEPLPVSPRAGASAPAPLRASSGDSSSPAGATRSRVQTPLTHAQPAHGTAASHAAPEGAANTPRSRPRGGLQYSEQPLQPGAAASGAVQSPQSGAAAMRVQGASAPSQAVQAGGAQARGLHATEPEPIRARVQSAELRRARPPQPSAAESIGQAPRAGAPDKTSAKELGKSRPPQSSAAESIGQAPRAGAPDKTSAQELGKSRPPQPSAAESIGQAPRAGAPDKTSAQERGKSRPSRPEAEDKWAWARSAQADLTMPEVQVAQLRGAPAPAPIARRGLSSRASRTPPEPTRTNVPVAPDPSSHKPAAPSARDAVKTDARTPQGATALPVQVATHRHVAQPLATHSAIPELSQSRPPGRSATTQGPWSVSSTGFSAPHSSIPDLSQSRPPRSAATTHVPRSAGPESLGAAHSVSISPSRAVGTAPESMRAREPRRTVATHVPGGPASTYLSVPPGAMVSEAHVDVVDARASRAALAESRAPAAAPPPHVQSELIELTALRADERDDRSELDDAPRLRLDDAALWGSSLHSAQVAFGREVVRGAMQLDESEVQESLRLGSQRVTEPLPVSKLRRAAWRRWLRAALGGVVLGVAASVAVGYSAVWMPQLLPRAEQMPVLLTAEPADAPRDAVELLPPGEETSVSAAADPGAQAAATGLQPKAATSALSESAEPARSNPHPAAGLHAGASSATRESLRAVLQFPPDAPATEPRGDADRGAQAAQPASADTNAARSAQTGRAAEAVIASALAPQRPGASEVGAASGRVNAHSNAAADSASNHTGDRDAVSVGAQLAAATASATARERDAANVGSQALAASVNPLAPEPALFGANAAQPSTADRAHAVQVTPPPPPAAAANPATAERAHAVQVTPPPPLAAVANPATTGSVQASAAGLPDTSAATRPAGPPPSAAFAALDEALGASRGAAAQPQAAAAAPQPAAATSGPQPVLMVTPLSAAAGDSVPGLPEQPSRDQVRDTMLAMHATLTACAAGKHGTTFANVTIQGDGRVSYSLIEGAFAGTESGSCMARALRSATFPRFAGPPFKVRYPLVF